MRPFRHTLLLSFLSLSILFSFIVYSLLLARVWLSNYYRTLLAFVPKKMLKYPQLRTNCLTFLPIARLHHLEIASGNADILPDACEDSSLVMAIAILNHLNIALLGSRASCPHASETLALPGL